MSYDAYDEGGYYDEYGNWIVTLPAGTDPEEAKIDADGRLLDAHKLWEMSQVDLPEDFNLFVSKYAPPCMSSKADWHRSSKIAWPDLDFTVELKRFDLFECRVPHCQLGTAVEADSAKFRRLPNYVPIRSLYLLNKGYEFTKELAVEIAAPPRRSKYRPTTQKNTRDLSEWTPKETVIGLHGSKGVPGAIDYFISWSDSPDRYRITWDQEVEVGWRILYRFAGYPATQFYILEKRVYHDCLAAEGGSGVTYDVVHGPMVFARKDWRLTGSFFGFDHQLAGSSKFTIYYRDDPFPRVNIAVGPMNRPEEWTVRGHFYAFDCPIPGTCMFYLQHCIRSIHSIAASLSRHRITIEEPRMPWEFRMKIYVMPVRIDDISLLDHPLTEAELNGSISGGGH